MCLAILPQVMERALKQGRRIKRQRQKALAIGDEPPVEVIDCDVLLQVLNNAQALYAEHCLLTGKCQIS